LKRLHNTLATANRNRVRQALKVETRDDVHSSADSSEATVGDATRFGS